MIDFHVVLGCLATMLSGKKKVFGIRFVTVLSILTRKRCLHFVDFSVPF